MTQTGDGHRTETTERRGESSRHFSLSAGRSPVKVRGGISPGAILTGVVVALGATILLSALIGLALTAAGLVSEGLAAVGLAQTDATRASVIAGGGFVVALFFAYLWGGYAAGRMARGKGLLNGVLTPVVTLLLALLLGALVAVVGNATGLQPPPLPTTPLPLTTLAQLATGIGILALAVQLLGGALGGVLGGRWHTKLEKRLGSEGRPTVEGTLGRTWDKTDQGTDRSFAGKLGFRRRRPEEGLPPEAEQGTSN